MKLKNLQLFLLTAKILENLLEDNSYDIYSEVKERRDKNLKQLKTEKKEIEN
jgi:hypothetical protein